MFDVFAWPDYCVHSFPWLCRHKGLGLYIPSRAHVSIAVHRNMQVVGRYLDGVMENVQQQTKAMMQAFSGGEASLPWTLEQDENNQHVLGVLRVSMTIELQKQHYSSLQQTRLQIQHSSHRMHLARSRPFEPRAVCGAQCLEVPFSRLRR